MKDIGFEAASLASQYLHKHAARFGLDKDCVILDVGAGTGMVAQLVCNRHGRTTGIYTVYVVYIEIFFYSIFMITKIN